MSHTYCMDVIQWAKEYDGPPFHALLCDPPYHLTSIVKRFGKTSLEDDTQTSEDARERSTPYARGSVGFMGKVWDGGDIAFRPETWIALAQHLFPGAFGMAYGAARNYHRLASAIEDAGLIIHPMIGWVYSSGFPKATNISKQLEKSAVQPEEYTGIWDGHRYGLQALKPALEPIVVFQRPYDGKPIENIMKTGAGAINIDAGRIPSDAPYVINTWDDDAHPFGEGAGNEYTGRQENSRWPANLVLDKNEDVTKLFPETGKSTGGRSGHTAAYGGGYKQEYYGDKKPGFGDSGSAARLFYNVVQDQLDEGDPIYYCKKASPTEREAGLEEFESEIVDDGRTKKIDNPYLRGKTQRKNTHPTVKPIDLSRYLASLLLPPIAYYPRRIMIPFAGVHSEAIGATLAGWEDVTAIEIDARYCELGKARARYWKKKG